MICNLNHPEWRSDRIEILNLFIFFHFKLLLSDPNIRESGYSYHQHIVPLLPIRWFIYQVTCYKIETSKTDLKRGYHSSFVPEYSSSSETFAACLDRTYSIKKGTFAEYH